MIMNYNQWFHKYHEYLTGSRNGIKSFNDTKWETINKRYQNLIALDSQLIDRQPYGVVGNYYGFQQLTDLMERSNYSFEDLNESLIETYKMSLQNAMSDMLVNTHAVIASVKYGDSKSVSTDRFGDFIVDVPYDQLHFGDRDEFIRQKLHKMYETESKYYVPANEFLSDEISSILGFTLLCTVNGFMVGNWSVGVDDKGFRFKIPWNQTADPNFIIYKLDSSKVIEGVVPSIYITNEQTIPYTMFQNTKDVRSWIGCNCLVEVYDEQYQNSVLVAPNFGCLTRYGLDIKNIQTHTLNKIQQLNSKNLNVRVYVLKYIHEIPNVFPAINYYNMMGKQVVYDDQWNHVANEDGGRIILQHTESIAMNEVCTPPICVDRPSDMSYRTLTNCFGMITQLETLKPTITKLGVDCNVGPSIATSQYIETNIKSVSSSIASVLRSQYETYLKCAIVTSMISHDNLKRFETLIQKFETLGNVTATYSEVQKYVFDELFDDNFQLFIDEIAQPFALEPFTSLRVIADSFTNYFAVDNEHRFNRPISEQCFITLKYDRAESCWLFDTPTIQHFSGIGNTFYIRNDLRGDELYKFFILYTDTKNPHEETTEPFSVEQLIDFDQFTKEVDRHIGFVKYWHVENRLEKFANMMYMDDYNNAKINVLSKILQQKMNGDTFLEYPSMMNYEPSNASSDHLDANEDDIRAPFALNFMFYTLQMMYDNKDQLLAYLIHMIVEKEFYPRYADLSIDEMDSSLETELVNYGIVMTCPYWIPDPEKAHCSFPDTNEVTLYAGLPFVVGTDHNVFPLNAQSYRNTLNRYQPTQKHILFTNDGVDPNYYVEYTDPVQSMILDEYQYYDDAKIANMVSLYLSDVYNHINNLVTNYTSIWNQRTEIQNTLHCMEKHANAIREFVSERGDNFNPQSSQTPGIVATFEDITQDTLYQTLQTLYDQVSEMYIWTNTLANKSFKLYGLVSTILMIMQKVFDYTGFDLYAIARIRRLYLQLKEINTNMSLHQLEYWAQTLDMTTMNELHNLYSDNPNVLYTKTLFQTYAAHLQIFINQIQTNAPLIQSTLDDIDGSVFTSSLIPLASYCDGIAQSYLFDIYILDKVELGSVTLQEKPVYGYVTIANSDDHMHLPNVSKTGDSAILFHIMYEEVNSEYVITRVIPTCEFAFFDGSDVTVSFVICDGEGSTLQTLNDITLSFQKVSSSSNIMNDIRKYIGSQNLRLNVQNVHETFTTNTNDEVVNQPHSELHYELLAGNHFKPLEKMSEYQNPNTDDLQGPNDAIYIPCNELNRYGIISQELRPPKTMFFKACEVIHITPSENVIESIGGKYHVGQTVYAYTDDGMSLFPLIITAIDHSRAHGMIEAKVDEHHAKWFGTNDYNVMHKYLMQNITCTIADDNVRNFLDEYNEPNLPEPLTEIFNKEMHAIYIGSARVQQQDETITINMIRHNFNTLTDPELYPVLRTEPDDHSVWDQEREVFQNEITQTMTKISSTAMQIQALSIALQHATTKAEKDEIKIQIENAQMKMKYYDDNVKRFKLYLEQLETPTTWYNVISYEAALTYINNGRAYISHVYRPHIQDLMYSDQVQIRLYDMDTQSWIDSNLYTVDETIEDGLLFDHYHEFDTNDVLTSLTITFVDSAFASRRILIFFAYDNSDVFDDIQLNQDTCQVRFRPVVTIDPSHYTDNLYANIRIRKHYDTDEAYAVSQLDPVPEDFPYQEGVLLKRYQRSGLHTEGSTTRFCNMTVESDGSEYAIDDFDVYVPNPMKDTSIPQQQMQISYVTSTKIDINGFEPNKRITLICIQNSSEKSFDGGASNIIFRGRTTDDDIEIIDSNLTTDATQTYLCTVIPDESHHMSGGLISIKRTCEWVTISNITNWMKLISPTYRLIPDTCILVPNGITLDEHAIIRLSNHYKLNSDEFIEDPFVYYYDQTNDVRYPIADIRKNDIHTRLIVDPSDNPSINSIRSNYLHVSRYVASHIPENGVIDLTGYVPTPLSRDRYEFWVNGRYVNDDNHLTILSPTTFQLRNLTSLRNLEVIELVDDLEDSVITQNGTCYIDINGKTYPTYQLASLQNANIIDQKIQFKFNQNTVSKLDQYVPDQIRITNNVDIEHDILDYIVPPQNLSYDDTTNHPTINGVTLQNETSTSLGFVEMNHETILNMMDDVWKREIMTGGMQSSRDVQNLTRAQSFQQLKCHVYKDKYYDVYAIGSNQFTYTLYISNTPDAPITDTENVVKIIPAILPTTHVALSFKYSGKWVLSTMPNTYPIQLPEHEYDPEPLPTTAIYIRDCNTRAIVQEFADGPLVYDNAKTWFRNESDPNALYEFVITPAYRYNENYLETETGSLSGMQNLKKFFLYTTREHYMPNAFLASCTNLDEVHWSSVVERIDPAFIPGTAVKEIHINASPNCSIHNYAFTGTYSLERIYINQPAGSIAGAPWDAQNAEVIWLG